MRFLFLMAVLSFSGKILFSQYTVTKVVGTVKNTTTKETLKIGSKMSETDKLQFSSPSDLVRLIVLGKGTFVLQANPQAVQQENTVLEILKSNFHLKSKEGYLSGRAGNFETIPEAMETESEYSEYNRIGAINPYLIDQDQNPVADGNKYFLQITIPNQPPITHPLKTSKDTLFLLATDFVVPVTDNLKAATYSLGYFTKADNRSRLLVTIKPYFDRTNEMEAIIKTLLETLPGNDKTILEKECYKEVYEALGKPSDIAYQKAFHELYAKRKTK